MGETGKTEIITEDMAGEALKKALKIFAMGCKVERRLWFPNKDVYNVVQDSDKPTKAYLEMLKVLYVNFKIDPISGDYKVYDGDANKVAGPAKAAKLFCDYAIKEEKEGLVMTALRFLHCQLICIFDEVKQVEGFPVEEFEYFDRVEGGEKEVPEGKRLVRFRKVPQWDGGQTVQSLADVMIEIWLREGMDEETTEPKDEELVEVQTKIRRSMTEVLKGLKIDVDSLVVRPLLGSSFNAYSAIMERTLKQNRILGATAGKTKDGNVYGVEKFIHFLEDHNPSVSFHESVLNTINHDIASRFAPVLTATGFPPSFEKHFKSKEATSGGTYSSMVEVSLGDTVDAIVTSIKVVWYGDGLDDIARRHVQNKIAENPKEAEVYGRMDPNQMAQLMRWAMGGGIAHTAEVSEERESDEAPRQNISTAAQATNSQQKKPVEDKKREATDVESNNQRHESSVVAHVVPTNNAQPSSLQNAVVTEVAQEDEDIEREEEHQEDLFVASNKIQGRSQHMGTIWPYTFLRRTVVENFHAITTVDEVNIRDASIETVVSIKENMLEERGNEDVDVTDEILRVNVAWAVSPKSDILRNLNITKWEPRKRTIQSARALKTAGSSVKFVREPKIFLNVPKLVLLCFGKDMTGKLLEAKEDWERATVAEKTEQMTSEADELYVKMYADKNFHCYQNGLEEMYENTVASLTDAEKSTIGTNDCALRVQQQNKALRYAYDNMSKRLAEIGGIGSATAKSLPLEEKNVSAIVVSNICYIYAMISETIRI